jgi:putative hydrolases of HD superfamily
MLEKIPDSSLVDIIKFLEITGILKRTPRTGWIDVGIYEPESVADHTFRTAILCMLYADIEGLDVLKMIRLALIHDLPESMVGDLTPKQKTEETKQKETISINHILNLLPIQQRETYLAVWNEYKEGITKEAKAVLQLEKIEMAIQAKEYKSFGASNKSLERFIKSAKKVTTWPDLKRLLLFIMEET